MSPSIWAGNQEKIMAQSLLVAKLRGVALKGKSAKLTITLMLDEG